MTRQDGSLKAKNEITADRRKTVNEADKMGQMPVGRLIVSMSCACDTVDVHTGVIQCSGQFLRIASE